MAPPVRGIEQVILALRGVGEPTRLRLVALLGHGELTVGEICRVVGQSQPRISRHLRLLTEAGLLDRFREQQRVYYRAPAVAPRAGWLAELLSSIDPEDPALQRDRMRVAAVMEDRQKSAATELGDATSGDLDQAGLRAALRDHLAGEPLRELLDIGTGTGSLLQMLAAQATHAVGVDQSSPALRLARARLHGRAFAHCEFQRGDMYALAYPAQSFDTVTIGRVLALAERPVAVLVEAARVLRRDGRLLVVEAVADLESRTGLDAILVMRQWLDGAGFVRAELQTCQLATGPFLLALAQRAAAVEGP